MLLKRRGSTSIREGGRDFLDEKTAAASATIDFVLTKWLQLYDRFEVDIEDVQAATNNVAFHMRTSTNAGSSYDSAASDYKWAFGRIGLSINDNNSDGAAAEIKLLTNDSTGGLSNIAGETAAGTVVIHNPRSATPCKISWRTTHIPDNTGSAVFIINGAAVRTAIADVDAVRFFLSSGNITSGDFRLFGVRK
jgi:hypothetical protein